MRKRGGKKRKNRHGKQRRDRKKARKARLDLEEEMQAGAEGSGVGLVTTMKNENPCSPLAEASSDDWSAARGPAGLLTKAKRRDENLVITKKNKTARRVEVVSSDEGGRISPSSENSRTRAVQGALVSDPDGGRNDVWVLSRSAQRDMWLRWWPKVEPIALEALVEDKPRYSTADSHTSIALRLVVLGYHKGDGGLKALLMKSALYHMRIVEKIHANDQLEKQKKLSGEDAEDPARKEAEELVLEVSSQDMELLGLPSGGPPENDVVRGLGLPLPKEPHYNPFEDNDHAWIESESRRLLAWACHPPKNGKEAVEEFVAENDTLKTPTSHALLTIRLMKVRDLVHEDDIKGMLLRAASSHLEIIRYMHL